MGVKAAYDTAFAQFHCTSDAHLANRVGAAAPSPMREVREPEIDLGRSVSAQVRGAMRRMLAAFHLNGAGRPMFAPPRRSVDRELQERWPTCE